MPLGTYPCSQPGPHPEHEYPVDTLHCDGRGAESWDEYQLDDARAIFAGKPVGAVSGAVTPEKG